MSVDMSIECRPTLDGYIGRESVDGRSTLSIVGRCSVDIATDYRPTNGRYCADASRWSIGQISVRDRSSVVDVSVNYRANIRHVSGDISVDSRLRVSRTRSLAGR